MSIWKEARNTEPDPDAAPVWVWEDKLLLLGIQSTGSYSKGYREISLVPAGEPDAGKPTGGVRTPGTSEVSSVKQDDKKKYDASIARYSVYYILQVPGEPVVFASTANNGLQSLKDGLWNAEE
jgi:hypothetical protein